MNTLGVGDVVDGIRNRLFAAEDVVKSCLARISEREKTIGAWVEVDHDGALDQSRKRDTGRLGALSGVPFGVKDVMDTADLPTQMGSPSYEGHRSRYDAGAVALARMAGGIVLGKTVTAEFAGTSPTQTSNPHDLAHTPGGSSSGSAAAVADFMVPFAFGTQTGGSVLRPAAFCGVVGFKPTYGSYPIAGMKPAAQSFDTVGLIARSAADIALVHAALMSADITKAPARPPRIGFFRSHLWSTIESDTERALEQAVSRLSAAGAEIVEIHIPHGFDSITEQRAIINAFERARGLAGEWLRARELFASKSSEVCERGFQISGEQYIAARRTVDAFRSGAEALFADADLLLTPATPGQAPAGKEYAGDPRLQELWTMLHLPSLSLPAGRGAKGLPVSVQLVGPHYGDADLLASAQWVSERIRRQ